MTATTSRAHRIAAAARNPGGGPTAGQPPSSLRASCWDTVALAAPERDIALIADCPADVERYQEAAGRAIDPAVFTLYRLRWYLDDLSSAISTFRNRHHDTADTRQWQESLAPLLEQLPRWLDLLS